MDVALVTGGAKRIGAEICRRLAAAGYSVAIHYNHSKSEAESLAQELSEEVKTMTVQADLSDEDSTLKMWSSVTSSMGEINLLVNNASHFEYDDLSSLDLRLLNDSIAINAIAPLLLCKAFAAQPNGRGSIINILDQKLANPNSDYLSYTASKAMLSSLTETLALSLAPNVRINAVAPGLTLPSPHASLAAYDEMHDKTPLARGSTPGDIADAVVFLAASKAITGQILYVDGGERLAPRTTDVLYGKE